MIEDQIMQGMNKITPEKTFLDKILAREDIRKLETLIRKPKWTREDLLVVLYLINSGESKLLNLTTWDRYILVKFFVWIREFVKNIELLFDYEEFLDAKKKKDPEFKLSNTSERLLATAKQMMEHNAKFLIDLYLAIGRTSLSINAVAFTETLRNKFEIAYSGQHPLTAMTTTQNKPTGLFRR